MSEYPYARRCKSGKGRSMSVANPNTFFFQVSNSIRPLPRKYLCRKLSPRHGHYRLFARSASRFFNFWFFYLGQINPLFTKSYDIAPSWLITFRTQTFRRSPFGLFLNSQTVGVFVLQRYTILNSSREARDIPAMAGT